MATTPTIVVGRNNWGIKNGNLLGYYQSDDGFFVKREFAATRGGGTNGTFVGSNGLIQTAASGNLPRIDFYDGSPALLVEPAVTNLARNAQFMSAQDFTPAVGGATFTANSSDFSAPDGSIGTINKYVGGAASGFTQYSYYGGGVSIVMPASGVYNFSIFAKAGSTNPLNFCFISFATYTGASGTDISLFSLASGISFTPGATIEDYGNGWYRLTSAPYTIASGDLSGTVLFGLASSSGSTSFAPSGALNLTAYTWGGQVEAGSIATSYIPTTTGSVTRNADVISLTGATDYIGQTEGTIYAEVDYRNFANITMLSVQTASIASGAVRIENTNNGTQLRCHVRDVSGTAIMDQVITSPVLSTGINKIAVGYSSAASGLCIALNGTVVFTGTAAAAFTVNPDRILLGSREVGGAAQQFFNNRIRSAAIYNKRLPNDQLQALTTL
jgi:hypothetical protein